MTSTATTAPGAERRTSAASLIFGGAFLLIGVSAMLDGNVDIDSGAVGAIVLLGTGVIGLGAVLANNRSKRRAHQALQLAADEQPTPVAAPAEPSILDTETFDAETFATQTLATDKSKPDELDSVSGVDVEDEPGSDWGDVFESSDPEPDEREPLDS